MRPSLSITYRFCVSAFCLAGCTHSCQSLEHSQTQASAVPVKDGVRTTATGAELRNSVFRPLAAARLGSCSLDENRDVSCWGVGVADRHADGVSPQLLSTGISELLGVSRSQTTVCAWSQPGAVYCAGSTGLGVEGRPLTDTCKSNLPARNPGTSFAEYECLRKLSRINVPEVIKVVVGSFNTCALERTGDIRCWGAISDGAVVDGIPGVRVSLPELAVDVAMSRFEVCAVLGSGRVTCWGRRDATQTPIVLDGPRATQLSAGDFHFCAHAQSREVWCWGANASGQVSHRCKTRLCEPTLVELPNGARPTTVEAGGESTCVLTERRRVLCWGELPTNSEKHLVSTGAPTWLPSCVPKAQRIANGGSHLLIVDDKGRGFSVGKRTYAAEKRSSLYHDCPVPVFEIESSIAQYP
jgi:hypothetical protein